ncbi:MAG TPA: class I SAM-dependent methyltransferase [Acidimicrobiales bacterium]|nr:class I SAM-dependent methyltransferase [Acidimicrobiales bacterium]
MGTAQAQGELWGGAPEDWAELQEPTGAPIYEAAFDAMGIGNGCRLLDVGCGSGYALELAHKRGAVGSGFDASAGLLRVARIRLPEADFRQGDLETLPYEDGTFDAVTAFNSVQYATNPVQGLREIKRVAVAGAPVAVATWGDPERCDAKAILGAVGSLLPAPPPGAGGPFALAAPGALEALVEQAGLTAERALEVAAPFDYADIATAERANLSAGPTRMAINHAGLDAVRAAFSQALARFVQADGTVRLDNVFRVVIAHA